jgi:outer membrane protein TolC
MLALGAAVGASAEGGEETGARLTNVTIERGDGAVRVAIQTVGPARYRVRWLEAGSRLVLDFEDTRYAWRRSALAVGTEPVKQILGSQFGKGVARIVVEFTRRVAYTIEPSARGLSITVAAPRETPPAEAAGPGRPAAADGQPGTKSDDRPVAVTETAPTASRPAAQAATDESPSPTLLVLRASAAANRELPLALESKSAFDFDDLKRRLAHTGAEPGAEPAASTREPVSLTLQQSIDIALRNNLDLRIAALGKESARREIDKSWATFHPTVGYSLNASRERPTLEGVPLGVLSTQSVQPFVKETLPTSTTLVLSGDLQRDETQNSGSLEQFNSAVTLSLIQPLLRGGRTYVAMKPVKDAEFDFGVADEGFKSAILKVTARAKSAYYGVLLAEKVIEATDAAIGRDKTLIEASQALFKARLVTKRDVFSAELVLAQDSARLVSAKADLENARNALLDVLGLPIGTGVQLLDREVTFEPVPVEIDRWIELAMKQRPEILALAQRLAKSSLNVQVANNGVLPQLDLVGSYGRAEISSRLGKSFEFSGDVWTAGLVFSIPIGNAAAKATLAQAELEQASLRNSLEQTRRQIQLEVRAAAIKLEKSVERMKSLTLAIEQAKGKLEVGRAQFALGQVTNLDITDAQQSLLSAETDLLTAIVDYKIGLAELEAAVGYDRLQF